MAKRWGKCDFKQLQKLRNNIAKLEETDMDKFCQEVSKELAARLLKLVIHRTPVGEYDKPVKFTTTDEKEVSFTPHTGKKGGTLRRGWTAGSRDAKAYAEALPIDKQGSTYTVEVINPVYYASYVEFGHRTSGGKGWVDGQYFLTLSEQDLRSLAPGLIEKKLEKRLREVFNV